MVSAVWWVLCQFDCFLCGFGWCLLIVLVLLFTCITFACYFCVGLYVCEIVVLWICLFIVVF